VPTAIVGEDRPGPILSLMDAKPYDILHLYCMPHTYENASETHRVVNRKYPHCLVRSRELPVSDPQDYSSLVGELVHEVRTVLTAFSDCENDVCVSSGTPEIRAAWFLLTALGILPAKLLQVDSPAEPVFGPAKSREVRLDTPDWRSLRNSLMRAAASNQEGPLWSRMEEERVRANREAPTILYQTAAEEEPPTPADQIRDLEDALKELQIHIRSAVMRVAAERIATVAFTDVPILLLGETGTGKELFARLLHRLSARRNGDLVAVNSATMTKELMESYLFGHVKGAFTGASSDQMGKFAQADGSTLFFDEIGELTPEAQAKLLRVLQDGVIEPLGSREARTVDVRIVAATNRNLNQEMAEGRFREDLYFRLSGVEVSLPPLRERREEIPLLAIALLDRMNQQFKRQRRLTKDALAKLVQYGWPGNVRELESVLRESLLFAKRDELEPADLRFRTMVGNRENLDWLPEPEMGFDLKEFLGKVKAQLVHKALSKCNGNQNQAAGLLGISRQAVNEFLSNPDDRPA
jgi:transcriptional regulator with GAF, ATPase, and Fis domain